VKDVVERMVKHVLYYRHAPKIVKWMLEY